MATDDISEGVYCPCPCGKGHVRHRTASPDHPYARRVSRTLWFDCPNGCGDTYTIASRWDVEGAPPEDRAWDDTLFVLTADVEERRQAREDDSQAARARRTLVDSLTKSAITTIGAASGIARYRAAVDLIGFETPGSAKDFAARRHVPTWVPAALRSQKHLRHLADRLGRGEELTRLSDDERAAAERVQALGKPHIRHVERSRSIMYYVDRATR